MGEDERFYISDGDERWKLYILNSCEYGLFGWAYKTYV